MMNGSGKIRKSNCSISFYPLRFLKWCSFFFSIIIFALLFISACSEKSPSADLKIITGKTMGTTFSIKVVDDKNLSIDYNSLESEINKLLKEINRQMSTYIEDSEISRFNNYDSTGWFTISYNFASLLNTALEISKLIGRCF